MNFIGMKCIGSEDSSRGNQNHKTAFLVKSFIQKSGKSSLVKRKDHGRVRTEPTVMHQGLCEAVEKVRYQVNGFQAIAYNINLRKVEMTGIRVERVEELSEIFENQLDMGEYFKRMQSKYKFNFNYDLPKNVLQKVVKANNKKANEYQPSASQSTDEKTESFAFGELKIFTWVLAVYCNREKLSIEELGDKHFSEIQSMFPYKSLMFIKYEIMCLAFEKTKHAPLWTQEEIDQLTTIIKSKDVIGEWRQISYQLYRQTKGRFYRPFQQCREKWFNHLDPKVRKGKWTIEEDINLLSAVECLDCKWIEICRQLGGVRTQHMIKNRYKSLIKKWKKKYEKTSPKKIVTLVLKHLKSKIKRGDLNSSMSSNEHEEVPVPTKPMKKSKNQETKHIVPDKAETKEVAEIKVEKQSAEVENKHFNTADFEEEDDEGEFDLGLGNNFNSWKPSLNYNPCFEEEREINAMIEREEEFKDSFKDKQQRKTAEDEEESSSCPVYEKQSKCQSELLFQEELFSVSGFQNIDMIEPDSEWLERLEDKWSGPDFDDIFGY